MINSGVFGVGNEGNAFLKSLGKAFNLFADIFNCFAVWFDFLNPVGIMFGFFAAGSIVGHIRFLAIVKFCFIGVYPGGMSGDVGFVMFGKFWFFPVTSERFGNFISFWINVFVLLPANITPSFIVLLVDIIGVVTLVIPCLT